MTAIKTWWPALVVIVLILAHVFLAERRADVKVEQIQTKAENTNLKKTLTIKRRQDEIRNAPRSDARTVERLRDNTF